VRWGCCGVLKSGTFGVFWHLSPNLSNGTVPNSMSFRNCHLGFVGKSAHGGRAFQY